MNSLRRVVPALMLVCASTSLWAAEAAYPSRPIRILVPFTPGGGADLVARTLSQHFGVALKQSVVVDNRPGGNTLIASELAARATPDGHTLLIQINNITVLPALASGNKPTVVLENFAPVTLVGILPHILVVPKHVTASSAKELIAQAKAASKPMTYASAGFATAVHLAGALFNSMAGLNLVHVPYRGAADYTVAVLGGHVDMTFGSAPTALPHIRTGVLRPLGVTTAARVKTLPDVPTIAEAGLPGYDIASWYGLFAPAGTPASIISVLHKEVGRAVATKEAAERLVDYNLVVNTPTEFMTFLRKEAEITSKILAQSGAKPD